MIRPLWVAFEIVGTPQEIEGVYETALGYGIVDLVSSSSVFMSSTDAGENARQRINDEVAVTNPE